MFVILCMIKFVSLYTLFFNKTFGSKLRVSSALPRARKYISLQRGKRDVAEAARILRDSLKIEEGGGAEFMGLFIKVRSRKRNRRGWGRGF